MAWLHQTLYHNEVGEPRAWTAAVTYIVSRLNIMRKFQGNKGTSHTTVGWGRHILIVNSDDRKWLHWFVCAWTAKCPYGPSKSTFGSHFLVLPWSSQC